MTECTCGHLSSQHVGITEFDINPCFIEGCPCDDFEPATPGELDRAIGE